MRSGIGGLSEGFAECCRRNGGRWMVQAAGNERESEKNVRWVRLIVVGSGKLRPKII